MNSNERLIAEVNGSMAIEGMPLTASDKKRMMRFLKNPEDFSLIIEELVAKHRKNARAHA